MQVKNIVLTSDHAGFDLKQKIAKELSKNYQVTVLGATNAQELRDFPLIAREAAPLIKNPETFGIFICGTGVGMSMQSNRYPFIRAAVVYTEEQAMLARQHTDANVLCLGARLTDDKTALACVRTFLSTECAGGRYTRRVKQLGEPV